MATQRRSFDLMTSPRDVMPACRAALAKLAWEVDERDGDVLTGRELPWHLSCCTQPARVEVEIASRGSSGATVVIEGSMVGRGPIQSRHLAKRLASLETQIRIEAEPLRP
jgi:hypothetical protein